MSSPRQKAKTKKRGPTANRVKIKGDWSAAIRKALEKKRPAEGWPEPKKKADE